ncbi:MAG: TadG family pilus assembly protein [Phycisphaerae bacterium]
MRADQPTNPKPEHHGMALVWTLTFMTVLAGALCLAVDVGERVLVKSQLQQAADAAAMAAAGATRYGWPTARQEAIDIAGQNSVNGALLNLAPDDVEFGLWNPDTRTFTPLTDRFNSATAVRVTVRTSEGSGSGLKAPMASMLGFEKPTVTASAVATVGKLIQPTMPALACPWLAGMPNGSKVTGYDGSPKNTIAPDSSPVHITDLPIIPGATLRFRDTNGVTGDYGTGNNYGLDGSLTWMVKQRRDNGINATTAPIGSLVGIFLDDRRPDTWGSAPEGKFDTKNSRNFKKLSPRLKQVFFIGDGMDDDGNLQEFEVPQGATRLYLGIMDEKGWWWDNFGEIQTTLFDANATLVK